MVTRTHQLGSYTLSFKDQDEVQVDQYKADETGVTYQEVDEDGDRKVTYSVFVPWGQVTSISREVKVDGPAPEPESDSESDDDSEPKQVEAKTSGQTKTPAKTGGSGTGSGSSTRK